MTITVHCPTPEDTRALGRAIGQALQAGDIIAMRGTLAAGKTTMTGGIAAGLDIEEAVTSPTFALISEYSGRLTLYHMDVYRLDSEEDFLSLGADEMLFGKGVCVIEWSEKISALLPESAIVIALATGADNAREISITNWPYGEIQL